MVEYQDPRGVLDALVSALATHDRVAVLGATGTGTSELTRRALAALGRAWPRAQGLAALADEPLGAFLPLLGGAAAGSREARFTRARQVAAHGLWFDGVHRADTTSLQLLAESRRWVATCRIDRRTLLSELGADLTLTVPTLDPSAARRVVRAALGPVSARTLNRVVTDSTGHVRLLRERTGRGDATAAVRARLTLVAHELGGRAAAGLALLGASATVVNRFHLAPAGVPIHLVDAAAELLAAEVAASTEGGVRPTPPALARVAHQVLADQDARHRLLADADLPPLHRAAHRLLAGLDARPVLADAGLLESLPGDDLLATAMVLTGASDRDPEDVTVATRALEAALEAGDLLAADRLVTRVPGGADRRTRAERDRGSQGARLTPSEERQRAARATGAHGWWLEAEAEAALAQLSDHGPSDVVAARMLGALDDPLLVRPRADLARAMASTFAWLGRDADARRMLGYLRALGVEDDATTAEVHWLAGRDHRARSAAPTSPAAAWAAVAAGDEPEAPHDGADPEVAAAQLVSHDPPAAAAALLALADGPGTATRRWRCRHGAVLAWQRAGATAAADQVAATLVDTLRTAGATGLLRRLGDVVPRTSEAADLHGLSRREREVVVLVGEGLSSRAIGEHLGLSVATVETHVASAMRKLGARTRLEAVARLAAT